jgi:LysM repeat protein
MKIPLFSKLTAKSRGRKVVRASARAIRGGEEEYYEAEPNMKLSHAFMVVLILHVVAVGGIYAFNHIKVNKNPDLIANLSGRIAKATGVASSTVAAAPVVPAPPAPPQRQPGDADEPLPMIGSDVPVAATAASVATTKPVTPLAASSAVAPAVTQTSPPKAAVASKAAPKAAPVVATTAAAAGTYKVEKGDNPYKIAKKLGVTSQDLLKVNSIEDPTKLQIGQVLKVPAKVN